MTILLRNSIECISLEFLWVTIEQFDWKQFNGIFVFVLRSKFFGLGPERGKISLCIRCQSVISSKWNWKNKINKIKVPKSSSVSSLQIAWEYFLLFQQCFYTITFLILFRRQHKQQSRNEQFPHCRYRRRCYHSFLFVFFGKLCVCVSVYLNFLIITITITIMHLK